MEPEAFDLRTVAPVTPAAAYVGGKKNLAKRICALIEATPHSSYAEPFVGMGGIFLRRRARPRVEAINDISCDVTTFFRVVQRHYQAFLDMLKWQLASRAEFERLMRVDPDTLTDLERAARFLYVQRLAFGGKVQGRHFGVDARQGARFDMGKLPTLLEDLHERLASVVIERLPYADFIRRYDHEGALFYLDPPYWGCEEDYGAGVFAGGDFERLAGQLAEIRGRFILSINDTPGARDVFSRFASEQVETTYMLSIATAGAKRARELIVRG